jgi:hypothetical protein
MPAQRILGLLLVTIGGALLVATTTDVGGQIVVAGIGVAFLLAYASTRNYGFLVPGGILTGLGAGIVAADLGGPGGSVPFGLGLGFVAIALLDVAGERAAGGGWWWPLIPGGILVFAGGSEILGVDDLARYLVPTALIVIGLVLLLRPGRRRRSTARSADERSLDDA